MRIGAPQFDPVYQVTKIQGAVNVSIQLPGAKAKTVFRVEDTVSEAEAQELACCYDTTVVGRRE